MLWMCATLTVVNMNESHSRIPIDPLMTFAWRSACHALIWHDYNGKNCSGWKKKFYHTWTTGRKVPGPRHGFTDSEKQGMILSQVTLSGIKITIAMSFVGLVCYLFTIPGVKCFLSRRICQGSFLGVRGRWVAQQPYCQRVPTELTSSLCVELFL